MDVIFLVGARACGKTTVGKALAKKLKLPFADTDQHLLDNAGRSVDQIVEAEGWAGFRQRESAALREVTNARTHGGVISTGGGMVLAEANRVFMRQYGMVVFLDAPVEVLAERLGRNPLSSQRPSLTGKGQVEEIGDVLKERRPLYEAAAHHIVDATRPLPSICRHIADLWKARAH